jgi:Tfp pilus assembly protein PilF
MKDSECEEETEKQYNLALKIDPRDVDTHFNYGNFFQKCVV